jgi:hypothetical protein
MTHDMLLKLMRERVITNGLEWLKDVLNAAGCSRLSDLPHATLIAAMEERDA